MRITLTEMEQQLGDYSEFEIHQIYNAMDCCVTYEVSDPIHDQVKKSNLTPIYSFAKALQGPAIDMMLRGVRIDSAKREITRQKLHRDLRRLRQICNKYADAINPGDSLNPLSPAQVAKMLYVYLKLPVIKKGSSITTERPALDKCRMYFYARPIVEAIIKAREVSKLLDVVDCKIEPDGQFRMSFNIAGTETGRWSSNKSAFGYGHNAQNITNRVREMFIPDKGMKFGYLDLDSAESIAVGYLSGDENYKAACATGDVHTHACTLIWPNMSWTKDKAINKKMADQIFYRDFSYRDIAKRGGHALNYCASAWTISNKLHIQLSMAEEFKERYFTAFPVLKIWHQKVAEQLQTKGFLITPLGRRRVFWQRRWEDATLREAVAHVPQSLVADILNIGLYKLWRLSHTRNFHCLLNVHDAVLVQYQAEEERDLMPLMLKQLITTVPVNGELMTIGASGETGWNWRKEDADENPDGLIKWTGIDDREQQDNPEASLLDRRF